MSGIRDVVILLIFVGLTPISLIRPWIGVLAWSWIAYMAPHGLAWGFARTLPVAMMIGGATLIGFLSTKDRKPLPRGAAVYFMIAFALHITFTTIVAYNPPLAWGKWDWVIKSLLMTFVMMALFQDRSRLRWLFVTVALSLGFYGAKGGIWVLRTGGSERVFGPDQSFFADNNTLGLALCMILPFLLYLSREEKRPWLKTLFRVTFGLSIIGTIFTYSRGAFLGLSVVLAILIWRSPWRLRFATALVVTALIAAPLAPDNLWERIESIQSQGDVQTQDTSTKGRLEAWTVALRVALDSPFTGGGFRILWNDEVWDRYLQKEYLSVRDAHSLYFEVLSEQGFPGLALYLAMLIATLLTLRRLRKRWRKDPEHGYISHYAEMTQLSLYPFMVAGAFIGVAYFDLFFFMVATTAVLRGLASQAETATAPAAVPAQAPSAAPIRARRRLAPSARLRPGLNPRRRHA
jgi:putative inorganic carbon (HCO3(-)) transporter